MKKLQVLVSTMHQNDYSLLDKMKINSDAIVVNQCDRNEIEEFEYKGNHIKWMSYNERGVGLSRNTALMRATGDICLFADDDVKYNDDYERKIIDAFEKYPKADLIIFNVINIGNNLGSRYVIKKPKKLNRFNSMKFGTYKIAVRKSILFSNNISFSLIFGGGAKYGSGEDSIFISDCLKKGMIAYELPIEIGIVTHITSTWFKGYSQKYFEDKGALWSTLYPRTYRVLCLQDLIRHKKIYNCNLLSMYKHMLYGVSIYKKS